MKTRASPSWLSWSVHSGTRLHKKAVEMAGLTPGQYKRMVADYARARERGPGAARTWRPSLTNLKKLRDAYEKTQYAKNRVRGLNTYESRDNARNLTPREASKIRDEMLTYAHEMAVRYKVTISLYKWKKNVKEFLEQMAGSGYRLDEWREFSKWYARHSKKAFPTADRRPGAAPLTVKQYLKAARERPAWASH